MYPLTRVIALITLGLCLTLRLQAQPTDTLVGHIAMVGSDFNIYVVGEDFVEPSPLTSDASASRHYQFPTWSTDGRLAFFCCDTRFSPRLSLQVYAASPDLTATKLLYQGENEAYTYAYWAPANCNDGDHCRDLALLLTRPSASFKVELLRQNTQGITQRTAGTGAPFYFSWHHDGRRMVWHRNNRLLSFFDAETNTIIDGNLLPRFFQAPAWSPVDDRVAYVIADSASTTALIVSENGSDRLLRGGLRGITNFSWSPDGRYIAYRLLTQDGVTSVQILETATREIVTTSIDTNVIAFFWSPDSTHLAYLTPDLTGGASSAQWVRNQGMTSIQQPTQLTLIWTILNIEDKNSRSIARFRPTESMIYLLSYFDQFNQSHRLWSPDSRYLVYGEILNTTPQTYSISYIDALDANATPIQIMPGEIGIWSYN